MKNTKKIYLDRYRSNSVMLILSLILATLFLSHGPVSAMNIETPVEPAPPPVENTEAPVEPAPPPVENTEAPVEPVPPPVENTEAPVEPVPPPVENIEAPVEPTPPPVENTEAPVEPTPPPVENTEAPVEPVPPPVENIEVPLEPMPMPVEMVNPIPGIGVDPNASHVSVITKNLIAGQNFPLTVTVADPTNAPIMGLTEADFELAAFITGTDQVLTEPLLKKAVIETFPGIYTITVQQTNPQPGMDIEVSVKGVKLTEKVVNIVVSAGTFYSPCSNEAPIRLYNVVALQGTLPHAIYALEKDVAAIENGELEPAPLILRVAAGECLEVQFNNQLSRETSIYIGKQNVHRNSDSIQTILPGQELTYRYFADRELGTLIIRDFDQEMNQSQPGLSGVVIVEPMESKFLDPNTGLLNPTGLKAIIQGPEPNDDFREFISIFQDKGLDVEVNEEEIVYQTLVNYPIATIKDRKATIDLDTSTPMDTFQSHLGDPIRFRVVNTNHERVISFGMDDHTWRSDRISNKVIAPLSSIDVVLNDGAGGQLQQIGNYKWANSRLPYIKNDQWGVFQVLEVQDSTINPLPDRTNSEQTAAPVINVPIYAGNTSVSGTAANEASVTLSVIGSTPQTKTVTADTYGNWNVTELLLVEGDTISVTAQASGKDISTAVTATVLAATPVDPPVANAGADQTVLTGVDVSLNGTESSGIIDSYAWNQTAGTVVVLNGADTATPSFTAPGRTESLTFELTVKGPGGTSKDSVTVQVNPGTPAAPTANAGADQTVLTGASVTLSGTQSSGIIDSYIWTQTAGTQVTLTGDNTATPSFIAPNAAGTLEFTLTVQGPGGTSTDTVTVQVDTPAPEPTDNLTIASARAVVVSTFTSWDVRGTSNAGSKITLYNGSSTDAPLLGKATADLTGNWRYAGIGSAPHSSKKITAVSSTGGTPVVKDVTVTSFGGTTPPPEPAPVANAGSDQTVLAGSNVTLRGTLSSGTISSYAWTQTAGTPVTFTGANTATPSFTAPDTAGALTFKLTVQGPGGSATDTVTVQVNEATPAAPVANAGVDQTVETGASVTLRGTESSGTINSYTWTQTAGTPVTLNGANTATPSFTAPNTAGALTFSLTVQGPGESATDMVTVQVNDSTSEPVVNPTVTSARAILVSAYTSWDIRGTAEAGTSITIYNGSSIDGPILGKATADAAGSWRFVGIGSPPDTSNTVSVIFSTMEKPIVTEVIVKSF